MSWFWDLVQLSTEIPLQLPVSRTLFKQSHNYVFHSNPQHLNLHALCLGLTAPRAWLLCGAGRENCCPSEVINKDHLQVKVGPICEMVQRKFGGFLHSLCEVSLRLLHVPVPRPKQAPSSFHRDRPNSSRNLPKWNLFVDLSQLTKAPFEPMKDTDLKHLTLKLHSC